LDRLYIVNYDVGFQEEHVGVTLDIVEFVETKHFADLGDERIDCLVDSGVKRHHVSFFFVNFDTDSELLCLHGPFSDRLLYFRQKGGGGRGCLHEKSYLFKCGQV